MFNSVSNRSQHLRSESTRFALEETASSGSTKSSQSNRWQDDIGLSSWANSSRQANERRDLAAQKIVSSSSKSSVRLENLALTELPPDRNIASLDRATSLSLSNNNLTQIASSVFALRNLKQLNVSGNQLGELPSEVGRLSNLRSLDASHSGVSRVPSEIGHLRTLEKFDLSNNSLSSLPSELGSLSSLKTLNLSGNTLHERAPELFAYDEPSHSYDTQQRGLPSEIKNLKKLQELDLSSNHFRSIPDEIGELSELRSLSFRHNALEENDSGEAVPNSIAKLRKLKKLDISDNPSLGSLPRDFGPLEYKSQKKLQLTRQGSKSSSGPLSFVSKKLGLKASDQQSGADITISVENTAIPLVMSAKGRLPSLGSGSSARLRSVPLYTPPPPRSVSLHDNALPAALAELTSQPGAAAPSMMARTMRPVSDHGGIQPMNSAPAYPMPYQQTAAFGDEQYEHFDTMRYAPGSITSESPDRVSNVSSDSYLSATEEFVPEPPPQRSSTRSRQSRTLQSEPARRRVTIASQASSEIPRSTSGRPPRPEPAQASTHAFSAFINSSQKMPSPVTQRMPHGVSMQPSVMPQQYGYGPAHRDAAATVPYRADMMSSQFGGMQPIGLGATSGHNSLVEGLRRKIAAGSVRYAEQQLVGTHRNYALAGGSRFSQREPEVTLPSQAAIDRLGISSVQASRLKGMSEKCTTSLTGDTLRQRVLEARQSRNPGSNLWGLGVSMHRQNVINDLAKSVAESNRERKRNSQNPADALLVDDPKQISMVYQTLVSKELGLGGFEEWRSKLDHGSEEYSGIFGAVVAPSNQDRVRMHLLDAIAENEEQSDGANVAKFVHSQGFWKDFKKDVERSERVSKHENRHG